MSERSGAPHVAHDGPRRDRPSTERRRSPACARHEEWRAAMPSRLGGTIPEKRRVRLSRHRSGAGAILRVHEPRRTHKISRIREWLRARRDKRATRVFRVPSFKNPVFTVGEQFSSKDRTESIGPLSVKTRPRSRGDFRNAKIPDRLHRLMRIFARLLTRGDDASLTQKWQCRSSPRAPKRPSRPHARPRDRANELSLA